MTRIRMMWYAGTVLTALAMLAASATAAAQPQAYAPRVRVASTADSSKADRQRAASIEGFQAASKNDTEPR